MRTITATGGARPTGLDRQIRMLVLAAGAAMSIGAMASHASAQFVWIGNATTASVPGAQFSTASNWLGNASPPINNPATTLTFTSGVSNTFIAARNDLGAGFLVNSMTFTNSNASMNVSEVSVPTFTGFNFVAAPSGALPTININGIGPVSLNSSLPNWTFGDNMTIGGSGYGNLTIASFGETVAGRSLTVAPAPAILAGTPASEFLRLITFNGVDGHTGGTTLDGGYVQAGGFTAGPSTFGTGGTFTVTSNGGGIWLNSQFLAGMSETTLQLNGTLKVLGTQVLPLLNGTTSTLMTGSGTLAMSGTGATAMTVYSNSTGYTGAVVLDRPDVPQVTTAVGTLTLSSIGAQNVVNGALTNVPSFTLRAGGTLLLNNNVNDSKQNGNRIGDTVPITMSSGNFTLNGPAAVGASGFTPSNLNETIGAISGAGYNTITATPGGDTTVSTTLTAASLARSQNGTFLFRGLSLGGGGAANTGNVFFASAPAGSVGGGGAAGSTTISILPYAIGDTTAAGTGSSLVTYDASGIRPLNTATEYAANLTSGATTNALLTANATNAGSNTVNALVLGGGSVLGSGSLAVTSGTILATSTGSIAAANTVAFGSAEGQIFGAAASTLTISGALTGSNGLTKSGVGTLSLTGNNSGLTGTLTLNAGTLTFNSAAALPGTGQIVVNSAGSTAVLTYSGAAPLAMSRDIAVNTGLLGVISSTAGQTLTLSGQISGAGGLNISNANSDVVLSGNNTYTGPTAVTTGVAHISSDANLGIGGGVNLGGGTLQVDGNWTTSRLVNVSAAASSINVSGNNTATLNGPLTNASNAGSSATTATLTKTGTGTLTIKSAVNTFTGAVNINGGTMLINDVFAANGTNAITVNTGATLGGSGIIQRNVVVNSGGNLSPGNSPGILTVNGTVTLNSGSNFLVDLNGPTAGNGPGNYDRLVDQGNQAITLTGSNLVLSLGYNHSASDVFWILVKDGLNSVTGNFNGLPEGATVNLGTENWGYGPVPITATISYFGDFGTNDPANGFGNDVVLYNLVPAPGAAGLLAMGGLLVARRRRR